MKKVTTYTPARESLLPAYRRMKIQALGATKDTQRLWPFHCIGHGRSINQKEPR